ncbi:hypothetical protein [Lichenicoccus roseus]|uniref:Uncharacterized protein n=1 Tax=Lichenicoccus roseus TaxID=2683649 RepID=A0A5R9J089_9PROT|nr:hypothetical protein [Lichenicoccus roseus]TLU71090.1 hypothetical protein FE263_18105 [Lichenicoccus roseus]
MFSLTWSCCKVSTGAKASCAHERLQSLVDLLSGKEGLAVTSSRCQILLDLIIIPAAIEYLRFVQNQEVIVLKPFARSADLIVRSMVPLNAEPRLARLRAVLITERSDFYIRSNGNIPELRRAGPSPHLPTISGTTRAT